MRQLIGYGLVIVIAAAAGFGGGYLWLHPKLSESKTALEDAKTQLQTAQDQAQKKQAELNAAASELTKLRAKNGQYDNALKQVNLDLLRTKAELERLKTAAQMAAQPEVPTATAPTAQGTQPQPRLTAAAVKPQTPASTTTTPAVGTREYVIKDGDSLWKIAAKELGNGVRFEEILKLNPQVKRDSTLVVGSKILIPAK